MKRTNIIILGGIASLLMAAASSLKTLVESENGGDGQNAELLPGIASSIESPHFAKATAQSTDTVAVGRMVRFTLPNGECRPAIITEDLEGRTEIGEKPVSLTVFLSLLDKASYEVERPTWFKCPVFYDAARTPGTWHWPK